jgi:hypothetical protein
MIGNNSQNMQELYLEQFDIFEKLIDSPEFIV